MGILEWIFISCFLLVIAFKAIGMIVELVEFAKAPSHLKDMMLERQGLNGLRHKVRPNQINHTNSGGHGYYKWTAKQQREYKYLTDQIKQLDDKIEAEKARLRSSK